MDWGNAIVRNVTKSGSGDVTHIDMDLHLAGDFKATEKKITWLSKPSSSYPLVSVVLRDYDYLVTKRKLEKDDTVAAIANRDSEFTVDALADANILTLRKGDIIQFERKGYFILDSVQEDKQKFDFIRIPDGRAAGLALKSSAAEVPDAKAKEADPYATINMYKVAPVALSDKIEAETNMYKVNSVYDGVN